jgi:hypothetical protein
MPLTSLRSYAIVMLVVQVSLSFIGATGVFPFQISVLGVSTNDLLSGMVTDVQFIITNLTAGGALEYFSVLGLVLDLVLKVILAFLIFVFDGFGSILAALGFNIIIWGPIQVIVDAVVIYDFAQSRL